MLNSTVFSKEEANEIMKKLWPELQNSIEDTDNEEKEISEEDVSSEKAVFLINDYIRKMGNIPAQIYKLEQQLKVEQGKEADLLHHIELHDFSHESKVSVFEMLQNCLQHRRKIKDEILKLQSVAKMVRGLESGLNYIECLADRKYFPRQLNELFA